MDRDYLVKLIGSYEVSYADEDRPAFETAIHDVEAVNDLTEFNRFMAADRDAQYKIKTIIGKKFNTKHWFVFDTKKTEKKNILTQLKAIGDIKSPDFARSEIKKPKEIRSQDLEFILYLQISPPKPLENTKNNRRVWKVINHIGMY